MSISSLDTDVKNDRLSKIKDKKLLENPTTITTNNNTDKLYPMETNYYKSPLVMNKKIGNNCLFNKNL